jgi:hypothetical protein
MNIFGDRGLDFVAAGQLTKHLQALGFSTRTANGLVYGAEIKSVEELKTREWNELSQDLSRAPSLGPKGIAEVEAFRRGEDPKSGRAPGPIKITVPLSDDELAALDAYREAQADKPSRPEALRRRAFPTK